MKEFPVVAVVVKGKIDPAGPLGLVETGFIFERSFAYLQVCY